MEPIKKFDMFVYTPKHGDAVKSEYVDHSQHKEEYTEPEYHMIVSQLHSIMETAKELADIFEGQERIEDWVQSKITISQDYLSTVRDYIKHR